MNDWIDVNQRLPERGGFYKVKLSTGVETEIPFTKDFKGNWLWLLPSEFSITVTHWKEQEKN